MIQNASGVEPKRFGKCVTVMQHSFKIHFEVPVVTSGQVAAVRIFIVKKTAAPITALPVMWNTAAATDPNSLYQNTFGGVGVLDDNPDRNQVSRRHYRIVFRKTIILGDREFVKNARSHKDVNIYLKPYQIKYKDYTANDYTAYLTGQHFIFIKYLNIGDTDVTAGAGLPGYYVREEVHFNPFG